MFRDQVNQFGAGLLAAGMQGHTIAISGKNSYPWMQSYFAVTGGLGTCVPLDNGLPFEELESSLARSYAANYEDSWCSIFASVVSIQCGLTDIIPTECGCEPHIELFKEIWPGLIDYAAGLGVKVAIENCPMLFGRDQWPGGQNLMTTPAIWRKLFAIIDSPYFGINYDPSHFIWQQMDYVKPLYEFKDKIYHVHFKDIKLYRDKLNDCGIMAYPLDYMSPKLPGYGDVNWGKYVSALTDIGFEGCACIEVEDKAFESCREKILDSITISKRYLSQFVI